MTKLNEESKHNIYTYIYIYIYIKQIADITDEQGLNIAHETKYGLYQHCNKLFIASTKDFPQDHIDDLKLPIDDILNKTHRGRTADAYYRSHHEIDTAKPRTKRPWTKIL